MKIAFLHRLIFTLLATLLVAAMSTSAHAAVIRTIDGDGQLTGARNVDVGGTLHDVFFVEGTCIALFGGCDEGTDFTFTNVTDATTAAQALLDQVFLDVLEGQFDTDPTLTFGCFLAQPCLTLVAFGFNDDGLVRIVGASNAPGPGGTTSRFLATRTGDSGGTPNRSVYASFALSQQIPEPSTPLLFGLGLVGLAGRSLARR